jgi:transcriptional regulator with XRE-family HTH domain
MKTIAEDRESEADRLRAELHRRVRDSGLTQRVIESRNGFTGGYLSQVLKGNITLTIRHVLGILLAIDIPPLRFFSEVFQDQEGHRMSSEIHQRLARYDLALEQLEEKGILDPPEVPKQGKT